MSKVSVEELDCVSRSNDHGLAELAAKVVELVEVGHIDARFARKIAKRIRQEADDASRARAESLEGSTLSVKLDVLDSAIVQSSANGLLAAMAELRRADTTE